MKILVDNIEMKFDWTWIDTLELFLRKITREMESRGRVITEVRVDGVVIPLSDKRSLETIDIIEIISKKPNILLVEALAELELYIEKFLYNIDLIVEAIDIGQLSDAIENLLEGIDGLEWIFGVLGNTEEILLIDQDELDLIFKRADDIMVDLIKALESKSYEDIKRELSFNLYGLLMDIKEKLPNFSDKAVDMAKAEAYSN